jgi:hypothetical protein
MFQIRITWQRGQGLHHLLYWYCWTDLTWWQQIRRIHQFHFVSNCHMENLSNGILLLHSQTHSRPAMLFFLPFPTNADTVSQHVNAWKKGNAFDLGPSDLTISWIGIHRKKSPTLPSPSRWGWEKDTGVWVPHWTSLAPIAASCQELLKCGCRISCSNKTDLLICSTRAALEGGMPL